MLATEPALVHHSNWVAELGSAGRASRPSPHNCSVVSLFVACHLRPWRTHPKPTLAVILLVTDTSFSEASSNCHAVLTDTNAVFRGYPASACAGGRRGDPGWRPGGS